MSAQGNQVGLNFANEPEAEEFLLSVEAVQRDQGENNSSNMINTFQM